MLTLNNLCYCKDHRLEICGICSSDYRLMNLFAEINSEMYPDKDLGYDLDDQFRSINAPVRKAPTKSLLKDERKTTSGVITNRQEFKFTMNEALITLPKNAKTQELRPWPPEKQMLRGFAAASIKNVMHRTTEQQTTDLDSEYGTGRPLDFARSLMQECGESLDRISANMPGYNSSEDDRPRARLPKGYGCPFASNNSEMRSLYD